MRDGNRVVILEIFRKFMHLSRNFRKFVKEFIHFICFNYNHMFPSPALQSDAVK